MFIARIIIKDVLYQLLSIDEIYLTSCRCYKKIESFFVIQALSFDIFDFCLAMAVLYHIYDVANKSQKDHKQSEKLINETDISGEERNLSEDRKSLISVIENDEGKNPNSLRTSAMFPSRINPSGPHMTTGGAHASTKPNIRLTDSFCQQQIEANKNSTNVANIQFDRRLSTDKVEKKDNKKNKATKLNEHDLFSDEGSLLDDNLEE